MPMPKLCLSNYSIYTTLMIYNYIAILYRFALWQTHNKEIQENLA